MPAYWKERQAKQAQRFQKAQEAKINKRLRVLYKEAGEAITNDMINLYEKLLSEAGEDILASHLYMYNRYYHLRERTNSRLNKLGANLLKELEQGMQGMYIWTSSQVLDSLQYELTNEETMKTVVQAMWNNRDSWSTNVWCLDRKTPTQRMGNNMAKLQRTLERGLTDCIVRGTSSGDLAKTLANRFEVSLSEANRLARTELTYIQNQATKESFKKSGIKYYKYYAGSDDEECGSLNGNIYPLDAAMPGVNYPPMHPNCTCTVLAVLEDI